MGGSSNTFSVIGADISIKGDIDASSELHIDGRVQGDLVCASLVQGEGSVIEGSVKADNARLAGRIEGSIMAKELVILQSARVTGDVHYDALTIEQGAQVDGRFAHDAQSSASGSGHSASAGASDSSDGATGSDRTPLDINELNPA